jgi:hypothetical protein
VVLAIKHTLFLLEKPRIYKTFYNIMIVLEKSLLRNRLVFPLYKKNSWCGNNINKDDGENVTNYATSTTYKTLTGTIYTPLYLSLQSTGRRFDVLGVSANSKNGGLTNNTDRPALFDEKFEF